MLLLFTAQVMGGLRTYVCHCAGEIFMTADSHCHDGDAHDHSSAPTDCLPCCEDASHSHTALSADFAVPGTLNSSSGLAATSWVMLPSSLEKERSSRVLLSSAMRAFKTTGRPPGLPASARHRHTLAMLI